MSFCSAVMKVYSLIKTLSRANKDKNLYPKKFLPLIGQYVSQGYWKKVIVRNYRSSGPTSIYLFEFSNATVKYSVKYVQR